MIDYINISCPIDNAQSYMDSTENLISWNNITARATGEVRAYEGKYKNLDFKL